MKKKITKEYEEPVDTSEEEVEEDFSFDPISARQNVLPRGIRKVKVELALDTDVVAFFEKLASETNAPSSQSQINQVLREAMVRLQNTSSAQTQTRKIA